MQWRCLSAEGMTRGESGIEVYIQLFFLPSFNTSLTLFRHFRILTFSRHHALAMSTQGSETTSTKPNDGSSVVARGWYNITNEEANKLMSKFEESVPSAASECKKYVSGHGNTTHVSFNDPHVGTKTFELKEGPM